MFRKFWLDAILSTLFIFFLIGVFNSVTAFKIFDIFDPIGNAFGDMEFTDIVFSQLREDPEADDRVVLVNLSDLSRGEIAMLVQIVNKYKPAVIGMDSFFYTPKEDTLGDLMLMEALAGVDHLVMASKLLPVPNDPARDTIQFSWEPFDNMAERHGFVNLITDAQEQEDLKMCREFYPKFNIQGEEQVAFGVQLASYLDSAAAAEFLMRDNETEVINYRGNVLDYGATKFGTKYFALDVADVFQENFVPEVITGKVVILCYLGDFLGDRESLEDKLYTPLNDRYIGRALPDMYGGVIHANIVSMILNHDYIDSMNEHVGYLFAIILCFLNVALFSLVNRVLPMWYDGLTKLFQLFEMGALVYGVIYVLELYSYKVEIGLALAAVALAGDSLEVYNGVVKNIFSKEGRKSLLKMDKL